MARFDDCMAFTLGPSIEGGTSNNSADHGGLTQCGVTQATYDNYRSSKGLPLQPVTMITQAEIDAIYFAGYWLTSQAGNLPVPVDMCVFDAAVNSGPGRSAKLLQAAVGVTQDGAIGPATIAAVNAMPPLTVAANFIGARDAFYRDIVNNDPSQGAFLKGWLNRDNALRVACGLPTV